MDHLPADLVKRLPEFVERHIKAAESNDWPGLVKNDRFANRSSSSDPASDALKLIVYRRLLSEHPEPMIALWKRELAEQMKDNKKDYKRDLQPLCLSLQYTLLATNASRGLPEEDAELVLCLALYVNLAFVVKAIADRTLPGASWLSVLLESLGRRPKMVDGILHKYKDRPDVIQGWTGWLSIFWMYASLQTDKDQLQAERADLEHVLIRISTLFKWPVPQDNLNRVPAVLRSDIIKASKQASSADRFALLYSHPVLKKTLGACDFGCQNCLSYFSTDTQEKAQMRLDGTNPKFSCCSL